MSVVDVKCSQDDELTLEWDSSASTDMIADSTLALLLSVDKTPASVKRASRATHPVPAHPLTPMTVTTHAHSHAHPHADVDDASATVTRIQRLGMFLEAHFGDVELHMPEEGAKSDEDESPAFLVNIDDAEASIDLVSMVSLSFPMRGVGGSDRFMQTVTSSHEPLRRRVEAVLDLALSTVGSLAESFASSVPLAVFGDEASQKLPTISEEKTEDAEDATVTTEPAAIQGDTVEDAA